MVRWNGYTVNIGMWNWINVGRTEEIGGVMEGKELASSLFSMSVRPCHKGM